LAVDFSKAVAKPKEQPDANGMAAGLALAGDLTKQAIADLAQKSNLMATAITTFLAAQDEELQILWWLFGARSWDVDRNFDQLSNAAILVIAKELADRTTLSPGPFSVRAILSRAVRGSGTISIPDAINACDEDYLRKWFRGSEVSALSAPIHFAVSRRLETGDGAAWVAGWAGAAELPADAQYDYIDLAHHVYYERLGLRGQ
jgi:hypothetical protein